VVLRASELVPLSDGHLKFFLSDEALTLQEGELEDGVKVAVLTLPHEIPDSGKIFCI
jgi:hypothetical protein